MCYQVKCPECEKPDWSGCGAHIEATLGHIPTDERCKCREDGTRQKKAKGGFLGALFGR